MSTLKEGQQGRVRTIEAGKKTTKRLYEMGLHSGAEVSVKKNDHGPLILQIHGSKIAISRKVASCIYVE